MKFDLSKFLLNGTLISLDSDRLLVGWGKRFWNQNPIGEQPVFYYPDFFLKVGSPWFTHEYSSIIHRNDLLDILPNSITLSLDWRCSDKLIFESAFRELQKLFEKGQLNKAVPYIFDRTSEQVSTSLLAHLLKNAINYSTKYPVYIYGMWTDSEGILGATPEILFDSDNIVKTVACAGTYPAGKYIPDTKTLQEHQVVVQGIQESLQIFGKVNLGELGYREFGSLGHLITPIELIPKEPVTFLSLVKALHPTPALGAFPREAGMQWLEKYQMRVSRGRFGAPIGYIFNGKSRCIVGIRNLQWNSAGMSIGAGCGVIAASRVEDEWNELQLKLTAVKGILGL